MALALLQTFLASSDSFARISMLHSGELSFLLLTQMLSMLIRATRWCELYPGLDQSPISTPPPRSPERGAVRFFPIQAPGFEMLPGFYSNQWVQPPKKEERSRGKMDDPCFNVEVVAGMKIEKCKSEFINLCLVL